MYLIQSLSHPISLKKGKSVNQLSLANTMKLITIIVTKQEFFFFHWLNFALISAQPQT